MTIVTMQDVTAAGYCGMGSRRWFEGYGFDFRDFMANGLDENKLLATGDAMALRVVSVKRDREQSHDG